MTTPAPVPAPTPADDVIDKQERVEYVVDGRVATNEAAGDLQNDAEFARRGTSVVPATVAISATYVQAELVALRATVDALRAAVKASGVTA